MSSVWEAGFRGYLARKVESAMPTRLVAFQRQALVEVDNELCSLMLCEQFANVPDHSTVRLGCLRP